jgi:serine/threonine-protein kinase HipA
MIEAAHAVSMHGEVIGSLLQRGDVARFVFNDSYWTSPKRPVLGIWFEDNPGQSPQAALRLPTWFSNLLPEGQLRNWVARESGVNVDRELPLLLHIGADLPGAVEIIPYAGDRKHLSAVGRETPPTVQIPNTGSPWKFSLAGVGMKFSMRRDDSRLTMPENSLGDWIVKLPDTSYPRVPENEFGTMKLAKAVGIDVPKIELVHRDQLPHFPDAIWPTNETHAYAIERFDRTPSGTRVHIEDFAQVRGWYSDAKYNGSFATVGALAYRGYDNKSLQEFVRRLTFNFLVGNGDAHLKNWSFIYPDQRIPELSPAYDLVSTGPYYQPSDPDSTGLTFGGTRSFDRLSRSSFKRLQEKLDVSDADVIDVVDATIEKFFVAWESDVSHELPDFVRNWMAPHSKLIRERIGS